MIINDFCFKGQRTVYYPNSQGEKALEKGNLTAGL